MTADDFRRLYVCPHCGHVHELPLGVMASSLRVFDHEFDGYRYTFSTVACLECGRLPATHRPRDPVAMRDRARAELDAWFADRRRQRQRRAVAP